MKSLVIILTTFGSSISIAFGIWHFFVPKIWKWYTYISQEATELVLAIRAINIFFSLSLIVFGLLNLVLVFRTPQDRFSLIVVISASIILWATRAIVQLIYPQGSINPWLQFGMLTLFIGTFCMFALALVILIFFRNN